MKKQNRKPPELLAPAGTSEALDAAIHAGADAVYLGGRLHNARMNARNFDDDEMKRAAETCHQAGVRMYVTLNTLLTDRELDETVAYADFLYKTGVDALIIADLGLARILHRVLPGLPLHASTQVSGHNADAARFLSGMGFSRMVCARELCRSDIAALAGASPIGIEMFIHGAHCVSCSGQCLMSSVIGGRSGNRGQCAQPCRMSYNGGYPLSLKDMCLAGHITEILELGVESLKIEGRMKSPEYVAGTVAVYRRLLDEARNASPEEIAVLSSLFSRSGFTDGYFTGRIGKSMLGVRTDADKLASRTVKGIRYRRPYPLSPIVPEKRPDSIPENFRAMAREKGGLRIALTDMRVPLNVSLPSASSAAASGPAVHHADMPVRTGDSGRLPSNTIQKSALFMTPEQIAGGSYFDILYLPPDRFVPGAANGILMPPIVTDSEREEAERLLRQAREGGAEHILVGNVGHIGLAQKYGFVLHGNYRLNIFNSYAAALYGFADQILSPELSLPQIRDLDAAKGVIVYGRTPLMITEKPVGTDLLRDRTGAAFPVIHESGLPSRRRDNIVNSLPLYMADRQDLLNAAGITLWHFIFTCESKREAAAVVEAFQKKTSPKGQVRRLK